MQRSGAILLLVAAACGAPARPGDVLTPAERPTPHLALHGPTRLHVGETGTFAAERNATACDAITFEVGAPCVPAGRTGGSVVVESPVPGLCTVEVRTDGSCGIVRATAVLEVLDAMRLVPVNGDTCGAGRRLDAGEGRWCGVGGETRLRVIPAAEDFVIAERLEALLDDTHVLTCGDDGCTARDFLGSEIASFVARRALPYADWVVLPGAPIRLMRAWNDATVDATWHVDLATWDGAQFTSAGPVVFRSPEPGDMRPTPFGGDFLYLARRTPERPYGVVRALPSGDFVGRAGALDGLTNVNGVLVDETNGVAFRTNPLEKALITLPGAKDVGYALPGVPLVATVVTGCTDLGEGEVLEVRDVSREGFPIVAFGCLPAGTVTSGAMRVTPRGVELLPVGEAPPAFLRFTR